MKKIMLPLLMLSATLTVPAHAAGSVVENGVAIVRSVLADVPGTLTNVVLALPAITNNTVAGIANVGNAVGPVVLGTSPLQTTRQTIIVPLPGPQFLNSDLINIRGAVGVNVTASGPIIVTLTTGPQ